MPQTTLINTLSVVDLAPSASIEVAHGLQENGAPVTPDMVYVPAGITATSTDTTVTFTNGGEVEQTFIALALRWHTLTRQLGGAAPNLVPQPFVVQSGGAGGGGGDTGLQLVAAVHFIDQEFHPPFAYGQNVADVTLDDTTYTVTLNEPIEVGEFVATAAQISATQGTIYVSQTGDPLVFTVHALTLAAEGFLPGMSVLFYRMTSPQTFGP